MLRPNRIPTSSGSAGASPSHRFLIRELIDFQLLSQIGAFFERLPQILSKQIIQKTTEPIQKL